MIAPGRRSWTKGRVILIKSLRLPLPVRRMSKLQSASLEMHKSRQGRLTPCANGQPFQDLSCCGRSFPTLKYCAYRMSGTKAWPAFSGLLLHQILVALDRNVRAGAGQNSSRTISNQGRAEVQGGRRDRCETPRASFIPAQANALGASAQTPVSAERAIHPSFYQPPA